MFIVDCCIESILNLFIGKERRCRNILGKTFEFVSGDPFSENGILLERAIEVQHGYVKYEYKNVNSSLGWIVSSTECDTFLLSIKINGGKLLD